MQLPMKATLMRPSNQAECPICMEETHPNEMIALHGEVHWICSTCVPKWVSSQHVGAMRCPLCRMHVDQAQVQHLVDRCAESRCASLTRLAPRERLWAASHTRRLSVNLPSSAVGQSAPAHPAASLVTDQPAPAADSPDEVLRDRVGVSPETEEHDVLVDHGLLAHRQAYRHHMPCLPSLLRIQYNAPSPIAWTGGAWSCRQKRLNKLLLELKELAEAYHIAIVITNQVTATSGVDMITAPAVQHPMIQLFRQQPETHSLGSAHLCASFAYVRSSGGGAASVIANIADDVADLSDLAGFNDS